MPAAALRSVQRTSNAAAHQTWRRSAPEADASIHASSETHSTTINSDNN